MAHQTVEERAGYIRKVFTELSIDNFSEFELEISQDPNCDIEYYVGKYLVPLFLQSCANAEKQLKAPLTSFDEGINRMIRVFHLYLQGEISPEFWQAKIWVNLPDIQRKMLLIDFGSSNQTFLQLIQRDDAKLNQQILGYYLELINTDGLFNNKDTKELHLRILNEIKHYLELNTNVAHLNNAISGMFNLLKDIAIRTSESAAWNDTQIFYPSSKNLNDLPKPFIDAFVSITLDYVEQMKHGDDRRDRISMTNAIRGISSLLQSNLTQEEYDEYVQKFKASYLDNFNERKYLPGLSAFYLDREFDPKKTTEQLLGKQENLEQAAIENAIDSLINAINEFRAYGETLVQEHNSDKGELLINLSYAMIGAVKKLPITRPNKSDFILLQSGIIDLIQRNSRNLSSYRLNVPILVKNILIALTGVGLLILGGQLLYTKVTTGRALFFGQNSKTTSEVKSADIVEQLNKLGKQFDS